MHFLFQFPKALKQEKEVAAACLNCQIYRNGKTSSGCVKLTGHAEVFSLLGLMAALRTRWSLAFLLFEHFTLGMVVTVTGLQM